MNLIHGIILLFLDFFFKKKFERLSSNTTNFRGWSTTYMKSIVIEVEYDPKKNIVYDFGVMVKHTIKKIYI